MIRRAAEIGEDDSPEERRAKLARALAGAEDAEVVSRGICSRYVGLELGGEPSEQSAWAVRALCLETVAQRRPVIVVFDDLHWAEPVLLDLIVEVATTVEGPVLCVCMAALAPSRSSSGASGSGSVPTTTALRPLSGLDTLRSRPAARAATHCQGPSSTALVQLAAWQPALRRAGAAHAHRPGPTRTWRRRLEDDRRGLTRIEVPADRSRRSSRRGSTTSAAPSAPAPRRRR